MSSPSSPQGIRASPTTSTPRSLPGVSKNSNVSTTATADITSPTGDSRIPRPSPTGLRRSASMRVRGDNSYLRHSSGSTLLHQYHQQRNSLLFKQQQHPLSHYHQQIDENFPVITENGIDSHRHRSFVSYPKIPFSILPFNLQN